MRRPVAVAAAGALACCYGLVLLGVAAVLAGEFMTGRGAIGHEHLTGPAAKGVVFMVVVLTAGAVCLAIGAVQVWRGRPPGLLIAPLALLLVFGTVGEIADGLGSATASSELIGAGILLLAATPLALLLVPGSRAWWRRSAPGRSAETGPYGS